ncbi:MAG: DegT/DnrJ/EryC1/StrS family aminotransferase [Mongoliitalea sp.]
MSMKVPFVNLEAIHMPLSMAIKAAFDRVLLASWYISGKELAAFEHAYAAYQGSDYAIGTSNGLDALTLALKVLGVGQGDEVIVPSHTYIATVLAITRVGATPVFVDSDPLTYLLPSDAIEAFISDRTKVILPVHLYGQVCDMESILEVAKRYGVMVVEDFAQAHGASFNGQKAGTFGVINASSFYPTKNLGALGDAGICTTDCSHLAKKIRALQNYGSTEKFHHEVQGYNMRLDELQAAFLSIKLQFLDQWNAERRNLAELYKNELEGVGDLVLPSTHPLAMHVYHLFVIQTAFRDELQAFLATMQIETMVHYPTPVHLQPAYKDLGYATGSLPVAEKLSQIILSLPIWPGMKQEQVMYVCEGIKLFFEQKN